jgi:UDP-N-acetylglucosamine/UDP-N-acetylgalactosamine diphosphorylase
MTTAALPQIDDLLAARLACAGQKRLLRWWDELTPAEQEQLVEQLEAIDFEELLLGEGGEANVLAVLPPLESIRPPKVVSLTGARPDDPRRKEALKRGEEALRADKVAAVLVAGGQGTRLGHDGPKGTYPVGTVSKKSLFQIHAEKVLAIRRRYHAAVPLYVMTSPANDAATQAFFVEHGFFGLEPESVVFFPQGSMPAVDRYTGEVLLAEKGCIATSPNGHGGVVQALADGGHLQDMKAQGIEYVFYYQVDNPLVKVADPVYLGYHLSAEAEMSLKVVPKLNAAEKMGVVVEAGGRLQVIEYSDLPASLAEQVNADGELAFGAGSIAVHIFNVDFLERLATGESRLPYHRAVKKVPYLDESGTRVEPEEPNAVKFEMFIFDALPLARKSLVVETSRREEFEPLKNATGSNSPASVQQAMSDLFADWLNEAGVQVTRRPDGSAAVPIEISPLVALDASDLRPQVSGAVTAPFWLEPAGR